MDLNLGIVGNCQFNALISPRGNVEWLCWPRFDSSFIFGGLLEKNPEQSGTFQVTSVPEEDGVQEYIQNTNVLVTKFKTPSGNFEVTDFAPRFRRCSRFHRPTMLIRIVRPTHDAPLIKISCEPRYDYGRTKMTGEIRSNHLYFHNDPSPIRLFTNGSLTLITEKKPFVLDRTIYLVCTWGLTLEQDLVDLCESYLTKTIAYWQRWVKHCHLPQNYQKEVIRSALTLKMHQFEDTGAIIAATTTSIPEANQTERTWDYRFCWLRDTYFTLEALRQLGQFEEMEGFVNYLRNIAENADGILQPVYSISGEKDLSEVILSHLSGYRDHQPIRIGNQAYQHLQHDIYGEMVLSISPLFLDPRYAIEEDSMPKKLLTKLLVLIDLYLDSEDAGLWEYREIAQVHTFSLLMHWAGGKKGLDIAKHCNYEDLRPLAENIVQRAEHLLTQRCWNEEMGAFTQAVHSNELDASLLLMPSLGFLQPDDPRMLTHIEAIRKRLESHHHLLHRYIHEDDFGKTQNAFTVCTFWLAESYAHLGHKDTAQEIFQTLLKCSNHLGLYSEDIDPQSLESWGNFPQAYSHVGLINTAFALEKVTHDSHA